MKAITKVRATFVIAMALLAALALLAYLNRDANSVSAGEVLHQAGASAKDITSLQITMTGSRTTASGATTSNKMITQMQLPDSAYTRTYSGDGSPIDEILQVGGKVYVREASGTWTEMGDAPPLSRDGRTTSPGNELVESMKEFLVDVEVVSRKIVDGRLVTHLRGTSDMAAKAKVIWPNWDSMTTDQRAGLEDGRTQLLSGSETVDIYIDGETSLLISATHVSTYPAVGDREAYTARMTLDVSRYDENFNFAAP